MTIYRHKAPQMRMAATNKQIAVGYRFLQQCQLDKAEEAFTKAIRLNPTDPHPHINLAIVKLLTGDFENGFRELEWRLRIEPWASFISSLPRPQWQGECLKGKTILLYTEQGAGDAIQSARFATHIADLGATVLIATQSYLKSILESVQGVSRVLVEGEAAPFDFVAPLFSLPGLLGLSPQTIPANCPYISAPSAVNLATNDLNLSTDLNIGLAWAGNPVHRNDKNRSLKFDQLIALLGQENAQFFSFQKPLQDADRQLLLQNNVTDLSKHLTDYANTASLMDKMDLIITVDTSVAHVAGALGKEVWVMLPYAPDWRWMMDRTDSPWYPSMRLFRQSKPGDWQSVIEDVHGAIGY